MFERFTEGARRAVVAAQEEARSLGHNHIGSEHLLLGVLDVLDSEQADVLAAAGITAEAARAQVAELAGPGSKSPGGAIPFTPRAKQVMELSLREALEQKSSYIGTEHLLLAVLREQDGLGARVLQQLGGSLPALRQRIIETARAADPEPAARPRRGGGTDWGESTEPRPRRLVLPEALTREIYRFPPGQVTDFRRLAAAADRRLAAIERRLGIEGSDEPARGFRGLIASVDRRLENLERHFGIETAPEPPEAPEAHPAGPAADPAGPEAAGPGAAGPETEAGAQ